MEKGIFNYLRAATLLIIVVCTLGLNRVSATTWYIAMTADGYDPAYLSVTVGDRVVWINEDYDFFDVHSTRSYSYPWSSGPVQVGYGVALDTTHSGTFDYTDDWGYSGWGTLVINPPTPPPPLNPGISIPAVMPDGSFQCSITNVAGGTTFYVEASTNLINWARIYTNNSPGGDFTWTDTSARTLPRRFYRVFITQ